MIKVNDYIKTYDLCTGEIVISQVNHVIYKEEEVYCWTGSDEFCYKSKPNQEIKPYTAIWDKANMRWVFKLPRREACFSTIVLDNCDFLEPLLTSNEKVTYDFNNDLY